MKIKWSAIGITNASGTSGGTTFAHNRGGAYARRWAKPVNAQTSRQTAMRSLWGAVAQQWGQLSQEEVNAWNSAGENVTVTDGFGNSHNMTGNTYFMRVNQNRTHGMGLPITRTPIALVALPNISYNDAVIDMSGLNPLEPGVSINLENGTPSAAITASIGFTVVSANSNKGYGSVKNQFNQRIRKTVILDASGNASVEILNNDPDLVAILGDAGNLSTVYLQVHTHSAAGQKSNPVTYRQRLVNNSVYTVLSEPEENSEIIEGSSIDLKFFADGILLNPALLSVTPSRMDIYQDVTYHADRLTIELANSGAPGPFNLSIDGLPDSSITKILNYYYVLP